MDDWSKLGLKVTQRVIPTGPFYEALRGGTFDVTVDFNCQSVVNIRRSTSASTCRLPYIPKITANTRSAKSIELYNKMLREADPANGQRVAMREFEKHTLDTMAHEIVTPWWYRITPAPVIHEGLAD